MNIATLQAVTYHYPSAAEPALRDVTLEVPDGAFALLAGPSAGGKSTLLRLFNGLVPQFHGGRLAGRLEVAGLDPVRTPSRRMALSAGMVFQEPEAQAVAETVEEEVAFGMEQQGIEPAEMRARLDRVLGLLGVERLRHRRLHTLSGGERQRVAVASVLALQPRVLLLDEPSSQLDPEGAEALIRALERLHHAGDLAILVAEHRLERLLPVVDQVLSVEGGRVDALGPRAAAETLAAVPPVCELARRAGLRSMPLTVDEARGALSGLRAAARPLPAPGNALLEAAGVTVAYGEHVAVREAAFTLREGEIVALVGPNGSGKTSLFRALSGLQKLPRDVVRYPGAPREPAGVREVTAFAGMVPQDPALALYRESVRDEIGESLRHRNGKPSAVRVDGALAAWGVGSLAARNPRDLSVGQQQRVAIGAMLAHEPRVWLLDEPTRGADGAAKAWLAGRLRRHAAAGGAAIVATHDIESAAHYATRVIALREGAVQFDLPARVAFGADGPLPTQVARLVPGALTVEEVELGR